MQYILSLGLAGLATAYPQLSRRQDDPNPWQAAPDGGVRAPCPGLNTLANHGYINRDGRAITKQAMQQGFLDAFNYGFDVTDAGGNNMLSLCSQQTGTDCTQIDLDMLNQPHAMEHDGSLSRQDAQEITNTAADNHDFNSTVFQGTTAVWGDATHIDIVLANTARQHGNQRGMSEDVAGWFQENPGEATTENAFYLTAFNDAALPGNTDPNNPQALAMWIEYFFENERRPTDVGWQKPSTTISNAQIGTIAAAVGSATTTQAAVTDVAQLVRRDTPDTIASLLAGGANPSAVSAASASAVAQATPAPTLANGYTESLSAAQWASQEQAVQSYISSFQEAFANALSSLLGGIL